MLQPYLCADCGRRFFNLGWHAEACGSSNFKRVAPAGGVEGSVGQSADGERRGEGGELRGTGAGIDAGSQARRIDAIGDAGQEVGLSAGATAREVE